MPENVAHTTAGNVAATSSESFSNWRKASLPDPSFTSDDVINAYFDGKKAGRSERDKMLMTGFETNLHKAMGLSESLYRSLKDSGILVKKLKLKPEALSCFDALFLVTEKDFLSDKIKIAYDNARDIRLEHCSDDFFIHFTFAPLTSHLNQSIIELDGYVATYAPDPHRSLPSRSA